MLITENRQAGLFSVFGLPPMSHSSAMVDAPTKRTPTTAGNIMTTLTAQQAETILNILQRTDPTAELRTDYSGRVMYGETCLGFVVSNPSIVRTAIALGLGDSDLDPMALMVSSRQDAMGREVIVYFPGTTVQG